MWTHTINLLLPTPICIFYTLDMGTIWGTDSPCTPTLNRCSWLFKELCPWDVLKIVSHFDVHFLHVRRLHRFVWAAAHFWERPDQTSGELPRWPGWRAPLCSALTGNSLREHGPPQWVQRRSSLRLPISLPPTGGCPEAQSSHTSPCPTLWSSASSAAQHVATPLSSVLMHLRLFVTGLQRLCIRGALWYIPPGFCFPLVVGFFF